MTLYSYINREIRLPASWPNHLAEYVLYLRVSALDGRQGHENWPHEKHTATTGSHDEADPATGRLYPFQRHYIIPYQIVHVPSSAICRIRYRGGLEEDYDAIIRVFCEMLDSGIRFQQSMPDLVRTKLSWKEPDAHVVHSQRAPAWNRLPPPWACRTESGGPPEPLNVYGPTVRVVHGPIGSFCGLVYRWLSMLAGRIPAGLLPSLGAGEQQMLLRFASKVGVVRNVYSAVNLGVDVNYADPDGRTALNVALGNSKHDVAQALITAGADMRASTTSGWTLLMSAAKQGYSDLVIQMINGGADIESRTLGGQTALIVAASFGNNDCVRVLADCGASVNSNIDVLGYSPLIFAAGNCDATTIQLLLDRGADPGRETVDHMTALRLAEHRGRREVVAVLKKHGLTK